MMGGSAKEVHYYVHGRGRGHATRALSVIPALEGAGYRLRVFAGEAALPVMRQHTRCGPIHSLMPGEVLSTVPKLIQRSLWACTRGLRRAPLAVISDGDLPSSIASSLVRVPVIAIGHGLVFSHCRPPPGVDAGAWTREARKAARASHGSVCQVPVSFCALPTMGGSILLSRHALAVPRRRKRRRGGIVCYFRDGNGGHVLGALRACGVTPVLFAPVDPQLPGVQFERLNRGRFLEAVAEADAVVSSAGHQLISETLELGVPHLALYAAGDDEQKLNVEMLRAARLGDGAALEGVDRAQVLHFLGHLPELAQLRAEYIAVHQLPTLEGVVVDLVRDLERSAAPANEVP
ncbi:MAG TPA: glycosyltransferase family protein [Polyangiaceae bacterium]|nr:glycosyltransferase family protein [Polyangiaceae bacterium]